MSRNPLRSAGAVLAPARLRLSRRKALIIGSIGSLLGAIPMVVAACGGAAEPPPQRREPAPIPRPDLAGAEPQVIAKIREAASALEEQPGSAARWGSLGMDLHAHLFFPEAAACYEQAATLDSSDYRWPYLAGVSLLTSQPPEALEWLERAARLEPRSAFFHVTYGSALLDAGDTVAAGKQFREALSIEEGFPHALLGLGRLAFREGNPEEALRHLEQAARVAPWINAVHELRAQAWRRLGDAERSELAALAARAYPRESGMADPVIVEMRSRGVSSRAWTDRGLGLEREGKLEEAEAAFRKVLELHPGDSRDYSNLGGVLSRLNRFDEAVAAYEKALEIHPGEAFAHNNLGLARLQMGDLAQSERHLLAALKADGALADALYNLALLRMRQGKGTEAEELLRKTLDADPAHRGALTGLGTALVTSGQTAAGMDLWRRAVAIDPFNIDARYNLAIALARTGEHADAIRHLDEALERAPNSSILLRVLAWELATAPDESVRDGRRAAELASRVHASYPDEPRAGDILAAAMAEEGRWPEAVRTAEKAVSLAREKGDIALADEISARLDGYRSGRPHRQPARAP